MDTGLPAPAESFTHSGASIAVGAGRTVSFTGPGDLVWEGGTLSVDVGGTLANVNRWRQQLSLPPITEAELASAHAKGKELSMTAAVKGVSVPFHPGAVKFYKEKGAL